MRIEYEKHLRFIQNIYYISKKICDYEVPISSVVVLNNKIIGTGYNRMIKLKDPMHHAEIMALRQASVTLNNFFLKHCMPKNQDILYKNDLNH